MKNVQIFKVGDLVKYANSFLGDKEIGIVVLLREHETWTYVKVWFNGEMRACDSTAIKLVDSP